MSTPLPTGVFFQDYAETYHSMVVGEVRDYGYRVGYIRTREGVVGLYDQGRQSGQDERTSLDFVHRGRNYSASWERTFTDRFLKTLAQRFAASVVARAQPQSTAGKEDA